MVYGNICNGFLPVTCFLVYLMFITALEEASWARLVSSIAFVVATSTYAALDELIQALRNPSTLEGPRKSYIRV